MGDLLSRSRFGVSQYYDPNGVYQRLDPRTRLVAVMLWLGIITASSSVWGLGCGFICVFGLLAYSRTPLGVVLRMMVRPLIFIVLLVLVQILFSPVDFTGLTYFQWGFIRINAAGILRGIKLLLRFSTLYLLLNGITVVLSSTEIIRALAQLLKPLDRLGLPTHDVVLLVQVALHFLPLLSAEVERIAKAQASRGAEWGTAHGHLLQRAQQTLPILLPLLISSLHRAENLAQAIEARGYGAGPRTSMISLHYSHLDAAAGAVILLVGCVILFL
jgi:energy-coupling factor transport system permease protein